MWFDVWISSQYPCACEKPGVAPGWQMPDPRVAQNLRVPDKAPKCHAPAGVVRSSLYFMLTVYPVFAAVTRSRVITHFTFLKAV